MEITQPAAGEEEQNPTVYYSFVGCSCGGRGGGGVEAESDLEKLSSSVLLLCTNAHHSVPGPCASSTC